MKSVLDLGFLGFAAGIEDRLALRGGGVIVATGKAHELDRLVLPGSGSQGYHARVARLATVSRLLRSSCDTIHA